MNMDSALAKEFATLDIEDKSEDVDSSFVRDMVNTAAAVLMGENQSDSAAHTIKLDAEDKSGDIVGGEGFSCATCGVDKALKHPMKCKKNHGRCANKRFCSRECEKKIHEKPKKGEDDASAEVETVDTDFSAALDAQLAKEEKKYKRRIRKQMKRQYGLKTKGCASHGGSGRVTRVGSNIWEFMRY